MRSVETSSLRERGTTGAPGWQRLTMCRVSTAYRTPQPCPHRVDSHQVGETTGDDSQQAEGRADQTKADLKQAAEKAKDAFRK